MSYRVSTPPSDPALLKEYLQTELENISIAISNTELDVISFKVWYDVPQKLREGDFFYGALNVGVVGAAGMRIVEATGIRIL